MRAWKVRLDSLDYNEANRAELAVYVLVDFRIIVVWIRKD